MRTFHDSIRAVLARGAAVATLAAFAPAARSTTLDTSLFEKHVTFTVNSAAYAGGALQDFPVLVRLSAVSGFQFGDFATPADELRFADASGTSLDYEIDTWDAASGQALVWVSLPTLEAGSTLTAYWAPDGAASLPAVSPTAVWTKADYVAVWHMNTQNADGSYSDATGLGATLEPNGTGNPSAPSTASPSALGSAYYVVPANAQAILQVSAANAASWAFSSTGYTTEAWIGNLTAEFARIFCHGASSGNRKNSLALGPNRIYQMVGSWNKEDWPSGAPSGTAWHHVISVLAPSDSSFGSQVYDHGVGFFPGTQKAVDFNDAGMLVVARSDSKWNHWMDEIRVRRGNTTADWAAANYATQADAAFLTAGAIEVVGGVAAGSTTITATSWTTISAEADFTVPASFGTVPVTATASAGGTVVATVAATSVDESNGTSTASFSDLLPGTEYAIAFIAAPSGGTAAHTPAATTTTTALGIAVDAVGDNTVTVSGDFTIPQSTVYGAASVVVRAAGLPAESRESAGTAASGDFAPTGITVTGLDIDTDYEVWFEIERTDGTTVASAKALFTTTGSVAIPASAYDRSVTFRVAGYTGAALGNFPVLVRLSPSTSGFNYADTASGGADLRFAVDGKRVPHEIETWNPADESLVWVLLPELSANRFFTMYYAPKSGVELPEADVPSRVWTKAGYIAVYHMDEQDTYGDFRDSSLVSGAVEAPGGFNAPVTEGGVVGGYVECNGALILAPSVTRDWDFSESGVTFEAWMTAAKGNYRRVFANGTSWSGFNTMSIGVNDYYIGSGNSTGAHANWAASGWNHMSFVYDSTSASASSKGCRAYDNGSPGAGTSVATDITFENGLGLTSYTNGRESMDGKVDEIRVRAVASSADWAKATHDTMANPSFVAVDRPQPDSIAAAAAASGTAATVSGTFYAPGGASVAVAYAAAGSATTNQTEAVTLAAGATAGTVSVTGLSPATDYVAWFVMNGEAFPAIAAEFTTDGSPVVDERLFGNKAHFTVRESLLPDGTQELEDFPVLVRLSEERVPGFYYRHCKSDDGSDIRFVDASGRLLASDVENWNVAGESLVWVNLPVCRPGTEFHMLYGARADAALPSAQSSHVWTRAGYLAVWHMGKVNADYTLDSPVSGMDATTSLGENYATPTTAARTVTRKWKEGDEVLSEEVDVAAPAGPYIVNNASVTLSASQTAAWNFESDGATFEFWCIPGQGNGRFFSSGNSYNTCQNINVGNVAQDGSICCHQMWHWLDAENVSRYFGDTSPSYAPPYAETGESLDYGWRHLTVAYEPNPGLAEQAVRFKNGEAWPRGTGGATTGAGISNFPNGMGVLGWVNGGNFYNGPVDELRVRLGVSSPEWAKAVYLSMAEEAPVTGYAPEGTLILLH